MIFAFIGLILIITLAGFHRYPEVLIGFGFIGFDLILELVNLKEQLYVIGKAIVDELRKKNENS